LVKEVRSRIQEQVRMPALWHLVALFVGFGQCIVIEHDDVPKTLR
jgi:hypothetical protein